MLIILGVVLQTGIVVEEATIRPLLAVLGTVGLIMIVLEAALDLKLEREKRFILYHSLVLFFANGGTECYITSIGSYNDNITKKALSHGLDVLTKEPEPTLLVIPEAVMLRKEDCFSLQQKMLQHCGQQIKFRFAILDVDKEMARTSDRLYQHQLQHILIQTVVQVVI